MTINKTMPFGINNDKVYFSKVKPDAIIPSKREEDGLYDIYACFNEDFIQIEPFQIKLIPTGIASAFSSKYRFGIRERGSSGSKGLSIRAGQIDSGYRGEWFIAINNTTNKTIYIIKDQNIALAHEKQYWYTEATDEEIIKDTIFYPYTKAICQAALEEVPIVEINELPYEELLQLESERGLGKLGSSQK